MKQRRCVLLSGMALCLLSGTPVGAQAGADADSLRLQYLSAETLKGWLEEGKSVTLLDVRQADEFAAGHIAGAFNVSYFTRVL